MLLIEKTLRKYHRRFVADENLQLAVSEDVARVLRNANVPIDGRTTLGEAFIWDKSPEGHHYWKERNGNFAWE